MQELNETDDGRYPMLLLETEDGGAYEDGKMSVELDGTNQSIVWLIRRRRRQRGPNLPPLL